MAPSRLLADVAFAGLLAAAWWLGHAGEGGATTVGEAPFRLREVAAEVGIDFRHEAFRPDPALGHIEPQIAGTGAAASVVDADGDGWMDLYVVSSRGGTPNALFRNRGDGTFEDVAPAAGLADLNRAGESASMGSTWADADGDGDRDAFVYAYGRSRLMLQTAPLRFEDAAGPAGLDRWANSNAAVWLDVDRDGMLDLYVCGYFRDETNLWELDDTAIMHDSFEFAVNGGHNRLHANRGDARFEDVTAAADADSTRWTYAAASADFDDDGWPDLYLANDYGPEELLLNRRGERFERVLGAGLEEDSKSGMCVALGNLENDGRIAVYVTNISEQGFLFQGNNLRLNYLGDAGRMLEVASGQVADCGWAWGAQFVDLDNDGWQDLFVANGFVSADPDRSYWYDMAKISGALGEVFADAGRWPAMKGRSLSGFERSRVLRNEGGGVMRDVAPLVGVDDRLDGRAVAIGDFWNDGAPDVVVANQRGPVLLYRNDPLPGRRALTLELVGTASDVDAIGATVVVHVAGHVQRHTVATSVGFSSQNDPRVHVGLGGATHADRIEIRWPSGARTERSDVPAGFHRIEEPAER